jgi:hypothetical protein
MCRELTEEECRDKFLSKIAVIVKVWEKDSMTPAPLARMEGLVHSILALIDGCSGGVPGFILAPCPHEDDKQYSIDEGHEHYWPQNHKSEVNCDISGGLHEQWSKYCRYEYTEEDKKRLGTDHG